MVKELKLKRCISQFNQVLSTAHSNNGGGVYKNNTYYCNKTIDGILLFYYVGKTGKFFINIGTIIQHNLHFGLDDKTLILLIHDRYNNLIYDKITVYSFNPIKRYKVIDGLIKW